MLRGLVVIPFALLVALGTGLIALLVATVVSPQLTMLVGGGFEYLLAALVDQVESGFDPGPTAEGAFALIGRLGLAILVAPVLMVALGAELFRIRSGILQIGLTGLLAALLPLAMLGLTRTPTLTEIQVVSGLFLVGAASGFAYWVIAGRGAGGDAVGPARAR